MSINEVIAEELTKLREEGLAGGSLEPELKLQTYYATFHKRFGPEVLAQLDGTTLLETMHLHGNKDSLVYWLEFKNDEEMPALFGSIAGGSALKFGIYRRNETGEWMTGSSQHQIVLTEPQAIDRAKQHRDELMRGAELLERFHSDGSDEDYLTLQKALTAEAPSLAESAWGHKYFALLYPDKLDDFHSPVWQRYNLLRLLETPPGEDGRYVVAGRFVAAARDLQMPMNHLTSALVGRNGNPRNYWRIGTSDGTTRRMYWPDMRDGEFVAIGWPDIGDLGSLALTKEAKEDLRNRMQSTYPNLPQVIGRLTQQIFNFLHLPDGEIVVAADGNDMLGIGRIIGGYRFEPSHPFPHQHRVEWLDLEAWRLPTPEGLQTTVWQIRKDPRNLVEIERRILGRTRIAPPRPHVNDTGIIRPLPPVPLSGRLGRIQSVLERKGQLILYGPPGTGKTFWAHAAARELAALHAFGARYQELDEQQRAVVSGAGAEAGLVRTVTFHPAYGYEEFLEGYRPIVRDGQMLFEPRDGVFKRLCLDAEATSSRRFYLIVDEINRGDIPRIFGELLTILELDKRGQDVLLSVSGKPFHVPSNVYLLGTMNTADRSIALLDAALRRRFGFIELLPDMSLLHGVMLNGVPLGPWLEALNSRIREHAGRDARNLQIGHSYLLENGHPIDQFGRFVQVLRDDVIPLLEEYTYEDYSALAKILGGGLIDAQHQKLREEFFDQPRWPELVQHLLEPTPDIATSTVAVSAESPIETL